jgi:hypothetical protein
MTRPRTPAKSLSGWSFGRLLVTGFMLLAFLFQSNATQTHLHFLPSPAAVAKTAQADTAGIVKADAVQKDAGGKESPNDCPLCQLLYGGQYVAPSSLIFLLPMVAARTIAIAVGVTPHYDSVSHSWRGRAPPRP